MTETRHVDPRALQAAFPLAGHWAAPERFEAKVALPGVDVELVGWSTESASGEQVVGSAGESGARPFARSYFELLERTSVFDAIALGGRFDVFDLEGQPLPSAERDEVFPESPAPERWRYARSNGVAAGTSWRATCLRAWRELVERDRVLRAWRGETTLFRVPPPAHVPKELAAAYEWACFVVAPGAPRMDEISAVEVTACFGLPRKTEHPLVYGLGARPDLATSLEASFAECLQRLGFLWGEDIPSAAPPFSPTADYHQEHYLWPATHARIRAWLDGGHQVYAPPAASALPEPSAARFVDLTPAPLSGRLLVVKALSSEALPLAFGLGPPGLFDHLPRDLDIHPIA